MRRLKQFEDENRQLRLWRALNSAAYFVFGNKHINVFHLESLAAANFTELKYQIEMIDSLVELELP